MKRRLSVTLILLASILILLTSCCTQEPCDGTPKYKVGDTWEFDKEMIIIQEVQHFHINDCAVTYKIQIATYEGVSLKRMTIYEDTLDVLIKKKKNTTTTYEVQPSAKNWENHNWENQKEDEPYDYEWEVKVQ